jgi:hypothetical protein
VARAAGAVANSAFEAAFGSTVGASVGRAVVAIEGAALGRPGGCSARVPAGGALASTDATRGVTRGLGVACAGVARAIEGWNTGRGEPTDVLGATSGRSVGCAAGVTSANVSVGCGVDVETGSVAESEPRLPTTDNPAPTTKPKITTPTMTGTKGSDPPPFGGVRRERRGRFSCMTDCDSRQEDTMLSAKRHRVIRVPVPIDVGTIAETASCAFALATPIRVERLLVLAVHEALGMRAPQDKRDRAIRATLTGFTLGKFVVDIDGRIYDRPEAVVVCTGVAVLRFFSTERQPERASVR